MWIFQAITLHRATNSAYLRNKIRLAFHFVEHNDKLQTMFYIKPGIDYYINKFNCQRQILSHLKRRIILIH